jgi:hypothetical protein
MEAGRLSVGEFAFPGPLRDQLVAAILAGTKTTTTTVNDDTLAVATEFRVVAGAEDLDLATLLRQARAAAAAR